MNCEDIAENATKVPPDTKIFTLGDPSKYNGSQNNQLEEGKRYEVYQCAKTVSTEQVTWNKKPYNDAKHNYQDRLKLLSWHNKMTSQN